MRCRACLNSSLHDSCRHRAQRKKEADYGRRLPIELPHGGYVPLGSVADVALAPTPNEITREGGSRRIDVTANARGRDLGAVAGDIEAALAKVSFAPEYHPEVLGEYAALQASQNRLVLLGALSLVGILLILHIDFGSVRLVALVFLTIPFALIGGVAAAFLTGGVLSLGSLVGFVTGGRHRRRPDHLDAAESVSLPAIYLRFGSRALSQR